MDKTHRARVILDLRRTNYPHLIGRGGDICSGLEGHPSLFLAPNPAVPVLEGYLQDLILAHQDVRDRVGGAAETRLVKANVLVTGLVGAQAYVQGIIDNAPPDQGPMIAKAAGMPIALPPTYVKALLKATQEAPGAPVHLDANVTMLTADVKGKVYFNWQVSGDGGKTWLSVPSTPHGSTDVTGLTALQTYAFRVSIQSRKGAGEWTDPVTFFVH